MAPAEAEFPQRLQWKDAFLFPVETPEARRDVLVGGTLILFLRPIGDEGRRARCRRSCGWLRHFI